MSLISLTLVDIPFILVLSLSNLDLLSSLVFVTSSIFLLNSIVNLSNLLFKPALELGFAIYGVTCVLFLLIISIVGSNFNFIWMQIVEKSNFT
jgi:hypothetical protein